MTHRECAETRDKLPAFYDDELPCETSYTIQEHMERCAPCRAFGRMEQEFTQALQSRLHAPDPPTGLLDRLRVNLDSADREATLRSPAPDRVRRAPWIRGAYAVAAALLACVLMLPVIELYAPGSVTGLIDSVRGVRSTTGVLVCFECLQAGVPIEQHHRCHARGHHTGVLCDRTGAWNLVASEATLPVLNDPELRGEPVVVEGRFLEDIRYIDASSIRLASR